MRAKQIARSRAPKTRDVGHASNIFLGPLAPTFQFRVARTPARNFQYCVEVTYSDHENSVVFLAKQVGTSWSNGA